MKYSFVILTVVLWSLSAGAQQLQDSLLQEGIENYMKGDYAPAIELFLETGEVAKKAGDSTALQSVYTNLGNAYSLTGKIELALENYQKATHIAVMAKDTVRLAKITKNIGSLYSDQRDFEKALSYFDQAEQLAKAINDANIAADCATNKAIIYEQTGNYDQAIELYQQALKTYESSGSMERIALTYNNLGIVYKQINKPNESLVYYLKTLDIASKLEDKYIMAATYANLANVYILLKQYENSIEMNNRAMEIAKEINAPGILTEVYGNLSDVYAASGDYKKAHAYAVKYKQTNDSLINSERSVQLADIREKYETEKKEAENRELKQEAEISSFEIQQQALLLRNRTLLLAGSLVFLLLFAIAGYLFFQWQRGKNKQAHDEAVRKTEEQKRTRIARDLHDDLGAGLTKIKLLTASASGKAQYAEIHKDIYTLSATASELVENMRDMVWALNPANTTLDYLVARIREYTYEYLDDLPIEAKFNAPRNIPPLRISTTANRNIFMIVKECLQNIVKHAEATSVEISLEILEEKIKLQIRDNGIGMNESAKRGNGLSNIRNRAQQSGGEVNFETEPDKGVAVNLKFYFNKIVA